MSQQDISHVKLHYVYDPLCGWCYGAAPLIKIARDIAVIHAHAGGMMAGDDRRPVTTELRNFVIAHDDRIARISGQTFGEDYTNGLLRDQAAVFDSGPPITAVLAAEQVAQRGLDLLARLQTAHYVEGKQIADTQVLQALAVEIGLDGTDFDRAFKQLDGAATQAHIDTTRALMMRTHAYSFPALVLERDGKFTLLDITAYYGRADAWRTWLTQQLATAQEVASQDTANNAIGCTP